MTNSKYIRLQELVIDTFNLDAPVEIEKGALLLESISKTVLLQLRLNVLDNENEISSTSLKIYGYTDAGEEVEGFLPFLYTYSDLYLQGKKAFGDTTPIILDPQIRKVTVAVDKVVYRSGDVWRNPEGYFTPPLQEPVSSIKGELLPQFEREVSLLSEADKQNFLFLPQQLDDYWLCACGRPNKNDAKTCSKCGLHKEFAFQVTDIDYLQNNLQRFNEEVRVAEEERVRKEEERIALAARRRQQLKLMTKPILAFLFLIAVIAFLMFWITPTERAAINSVTYKIESIGQIDRNSGQKIDEVERAYSSLDEKLQKKVENRDILADARATYDELLANEVIEAITAISEITSESEPSINSVFDIYDSLTTNQKALVTNINVLNEASETYNQLRAKEVIDSINSISEVTTSSEGKIQWAFSRYSLLTDEQKLLVTNYDFLEKANQTYNQLQANYVIEEINSIGVVKLLSRNNILYAQLKYDILTPEQKKLVTNYDDIQLKRNELSKLEVENVINLIDGIGKVNLNSSPAIETAKKAFEALTPAQQDLIINYSKLEQSIMDFSALEVNNVISTIDALGTGTIENKPKVIEARALYEKLDGNQKQEVSNYTLLKSIEETIAGIEVDEINKLIASLNLNYLKASDEVEALMMKGVYNQLPTAAKNNVKDYNKLTQAIEIFENYRLAKEEAAKGDYEEAYNLMVDLNYLDSITLAREYEKIAFRWWVEGGMTQEVYTPYEEFEVEFTVHGGKPGESIDVLIFCTTPDWTASGLSEDLKDGWSHGWWFSNNQPQYASIGRATMTLKNYATGEVLAQYEFRIGY